MARHQHCAILPFESEQPSSACATETVGVRSCGVSDIQPEAHSPGNIELEKSLAHYFVGRKREGIAMFILRTLMPSLPPPLPPNASLETRDAALSGIPRESIVSETAGKAQAMHPVIPSYSPYSDLEAALGSGVAFFPLI